MTPLKGYYSIVQYCPDLNRGETANIGIVLMVPDRGYLRASGQEQHPDQSHVRCDWG